MSSLLIVLSVAHCAASLLRESAPATLASGGVHVEPAFAPSRLVSDLRADIAALDQAGFFSAAGSGGRAGSEDTLRAAEYADPIGRPRSIGDFEALYCLWERLDMVRKELGGALGRELLPDMEIHYVRYDGLRGGYYGRHLDDVHDEAADLFENRSSRRRLSFICYLTPPDADWSQSDGGIFRAFDELGGHQDILPTSGTLVVFDSCAVEHEVLPTRRERLCLIGWFHEAV